MYRPLLLALAAGLLAPLAQAQTGAGVAPDGTVYAALAVQDGGAYVDPADAVEVVELAGREGLTLRMELPGPADLEVRTYDRAGRLVAGPARYAVQGGKLLLPLATDGLERGTYYAEIRCTDHEGAMWEARRPFAVRD